MEQHIDASEAGVGVKMHEMLWGQHFPIVTIQEHALQLQGLVQGSHYDMIFSPANARGKLGTAVWWKAGQEEKVQIIDYDNTSHRNTAVALRWEGSVVTIVATHAPTRNAEQDEHTKYQNELGKLINKYTKLGLVVCGADMNKEIAIIEKLVKGRKTKQTQASGAATMEFASWIVANELWLPEWGSHAGTWWHPNMARWMHIDTFMASKRHRVQGCQVEAELKHPWRTARDHRGISATLMLRKRAKDHAGQAKEKEGKEFFIKLQAAKLDRGKW